jgi:hypothetical protein
LPNRCAQTDPFKYLKILTKEVSGAALFAKPICELAVEERTPERLA